MADQERPEREAHEPSLELPSLKSALGFGRRRGRKAVSPSETAPDEAEAPPQPSAAETAEATAAAETAAPVEPAAAPPVTPTPVPVPDVPVAHEDPGPAITPGPIGLPETQPEVDPTAVLPAAAMAEPVPSARPKPRRTRPHVRLHLPGPVIALLTGAVVGLALVGLTDASLHLCTSMRGTSSCGNPGLLLLLVITVAMVSLGSLLLRLAGVDSHGSTSLLGVGLLVVVILLALLPVIFHWWMVIVVPLVAMLTFAAAWWLTTTYVEPGERVR